MARCQLVVRTTVVLLANVCPTSSSAPPQAVLHIITPFSGPPLLSAVRASYFAKAIHCHRSSGDKGKGKFSNYMLFDQFPFLYVAAQALMVRDAKEVATITVAALEEQATSADSSKVEPDVIVMVKIEPALAYEMTWE
ncbi:hypothetical protein Syun_030691 [Stephania yunnanensis]|uniref:Uncharacterized protein n=1 Tax=Stephania yunnanensis TaxID=152371 RepID=A0AAP0DTT9_9MAGN